MKLAVCTAKLDNLGEVIDYLLENDARIIETGPRFFLDSDEEKLKETGRALRDSGVFLRSVHAPFGKDSNLSALDEGERRQALEEHKRLLHNVSLAGAEMIIIHPGVRATDDSEMSAMSSIIRESLTELASTAEEKRVILALENLLPEYPGADSRELSNIIEEVDSTWLKVCFDTGHAHVGEGMRQSMEVLGDRIIAIHMQDNDGTRDMHLQPPYGTINWKDFREVIGKINYTEPITVEAAPWGGAGLKWMLREVTALLESDGRIAPSALDDWADDGGVDIALRCQRCGHRIFYSEGRWFCRCTGDG